jgi:hypothetical protein
MDIKDTGLGESHIITGDGLLEIDVTKARRVIIDIEIAKKVKIYIEGYGDERLIESEEIIDALMKSKPLLR